jgi:molybdopterin/thiamine biosynthesis adenylyltransferase
MQLFRAAGIMDLDAVTQKKIMIVGLGSLGSLAASNLVYPWRQIVLVEPEILSIENVERHLLGRSQVGRNKAQGVRDFLIDKGLDPESIVVEESFVEPVLQKHSDVDLVLVAIDRPKSSLRINSWAIENDIPVLYGGIYPKGTGGDIYVIPTPREVCYECAALKMGSMETRESVPLQINYDVTPADLLNDEGVPKAVPALHGAVAGMAVQMANLALDLVSGVKVVPQIFVMANTWEPIINVGSSILHEVSCIISKQAEMGIVPYWRFSRVGGQYVLVMNRTNVALSLGLHTLCSKHLTTSVSADDI